jgi:hypothetical protein
MGERGERKEVGYTRVGTGAGWVGSESGQEAGGGFWSLPIALFRGAEGVNAAVQAPCECESAWTAEEVAAFEEGMRTYRKNFPVIHRACLPAKSLGDVVAFYYRSAQARVMGWSRQGVQSTELGVQGWVVKKSRLIRCRRAPRCPQACVRRLT